MPGTRRDGAPDRARPPAGIAGVDGVDGVAGVVGIVGAGQLARMTAEAASALGLSVAVLAERDTDCATTVAAEVVIGSPRDPGAMAALARRCAVVTFDHEQVDVDAVAALERAGVVVRPGSETLRVAVDKAAMRAHLDACGVPVPPYRVLGIPAGGAGSGAAAVAAVEEFGRAYGWPVVLKAARGGYDGKGVWVVDDPVAARAVCEQAAETATPLLVEAHVAIDAEIAVVVARGGDGASAAWPAVETTQVDGVCREVLYPGTLPAPVREQARDLAMLVAAAVGSVGVLAVELFATGDRLLVNEIAARPHNSAHWTIEGAGTSQFENHLRAVLGLPLGDASPRFSNVASVNVFGEPSGAGGAEAMDGPDGPAGSGGAGTDGPGGVGAPGGLAGALRVPGAHVHLYGKEPRPGRKLGHVTVCGDDPGDVRARAWAAARALGTPVPPSLAAGFSAGPAKGPGRR